MALMEAVAEVVAALRRPGVAVELKEEVVVALPVELEAVAAAAQA